MEGNPCSWVRVCQFQLGALIAPKGGVKLPELLKRMKARKLETFEPATLGNIRGHGCRDLLVSCSSIHCSYGAKLNADHLRTRRQSGRSAAAWSARAAGRSCARLRLVVLDGIDAWQMSDAVTHFPIEIQIVRWRNDVDGATEAILLAHGFAAELLADLVRAGLATAHYERVFDGSRVIKVTRLKITNTGRRALELLKRK